MPKLAPRISLNEFESGNGTGQSNDTPVSGEVNNYNWIFKFDWITDTSDFKSWFKNFALLGYNLFYIASLLLLAFKLVQAGFNYVQRSSSAMDFQKAEMIEEIWEPIKGLFYFNVGISVLRIIIRLFFPEAGLF